MSSNRTDMKLSVITLTLPGREKMLDELRKTLESQCRFGVEHLVVESTYPDEPYGVKMRRAFLASLGDYVAYVDDDDLVSSKYLDLLLRAIEYGPEVVTITASLEGMQQREWIFRANWPLMYNQGDHRNTLPANHYCAWRRDIAKKGVWLPYGYGSEVIWAESLNAGLLNLSEVHIKVPIYHYRYDPAVTHHQHPEQVGRWIDRYAGGIDVWRDNSDNLYASTCGWKADYPANLMGSDGSIVQADSAIPGLTLVSTVTIG